MADSNYIWSSERSSRSSRGWRATRAWMAHGTTLESEALVAPPIAGTTSPTIPKIGDSHPSNGLLKCESVEAARSEGPLTWIITAEYSIPETGGFTTPDNPLIKPPEFQVDWETSSEPFEVDVDGIPVRNGGGFPFDTDPSREVFDFSITIVRNEPFYPLAKSIAYAGTVNLGGYTIPDFGSIDDGQALCMPIRALTGYQKTSSYVPVAYTLKLRRDGWRTRIKNTSRLGWGSTGVGTFVNTSGKELNESILIDIAGRPMDQDNYKVMVDETAVDHVPSPLNLVPDSYFEEAAHCYFVKFKKYRSLSFAGLL